MATRRVVTGVLWVFLALTWSTAPVRASGFEERVYVLRSIEDPRVPPDLSVCASASFTANAVLSASLYSMETRSSDGVVVNDQVRRVGSGTACALITSLAVGATVPIIADFTVKGRRMIGEGECVLATNTVPTAGLVLAGCTIPLDATTGVLGGVATSNSVFNPLGLPGFDTGSIWTVRVFSNRAPHGGHHH